MKIVRSNQEDISCININNHSGDLFSKVIFQILQRKSVGIWVQMVQIKYIEWPQRATGAHHRKVKSFTAKARQQHIFSVQISTT